MSVKSTANLDSDIDANIGTQTAPESVTPLIVAQELKDVAESSYNRADGLTGFTIPAIFTPLVNGDSLEAFIQALLDKVTEINSITLGMTAQGRPGLFLGYIGSEKQLFTVYQGMTTGVLSALLFTNDSENGAFDNGNNWSGTNYLAPFVKSYNWILTSTELEVVANAFSGHHAIFRLDIFKNGSLLGSTTTITVADTDAPGAKLYINQKVILADTVAINDIIEVKCVLVSTNGTLSPTETLTIKINSCSFSNEEA